MWGSRSSTVCMRIFPNLVGGIWFCTLKWWWSPTPSFPALCREDSPSWKEDDPWFTGGYAQQESGPTSPYEVCALKCHVYTVSFSGNALLLMYTPGNTTPILESTHVLPRRNPQDHPDWLWKSRIFDHAPKTQCCALKKSACERYSPKKWVAAKITEERHFHESPWKHMTFATFL